jgi:hypothetical protein
MRMEAPRQLVNGVDKNRLKTHSCWLHYLHKFLFAFFFSRTVANKARAAIVKIRINHLASAQEFLWIYS